VIPVDSEAVGIKYRQIHGRIPERDYEWLKSESKQRCETMSTLLRHIISRYRRAQEAALFQNTGSRVSPPPRIQMS
jgi:hypothetical protein